MSYFEETTPGLNRVKESQSYRKIDLKLDSMTIVRIWYTRYKHQSRGVSGEIVSVTTNKVTEEVRIPFVDQYDREKKVVYSIHKSKGFEEVKIHPS